MSQDPKLLKIVNATRVQVASAAHEMLTAAITQKASDSQMLLTYDLLIDAYGTVLHSLQDRRSLLKKACART